jgi:hypothetical protein
MKAISHINAEFWPNEHHFGNQFFGRFTLRKAPKPLQLTEEISKDYWFPTFYANSSCSIAIFHCDWAAAAAMMPGASMKPIKMLGGRSLLIVSLYEYRDAYNIPPYNEIGMMIPIMIDDSPQVPVLTMLLGDKLDKFGYHIIHMPVTSSENVIRGNQIWGLPKTLANVIIQRTPERISASVSEGNDAPYFEFDLPIRGSKKYYDVESNLYSVRDGARLQSPTAFIGDFVFYKNSTNLFKPDHHSKPAITLGKGPFADMLRKLNIESSPFQTRFCDDFNACFDFPMAEQPVVP